MILGEHMKFYSEILNYDESPTKRKKRAKILENVLSLSIANGIHQVLMSELAEASGVTLRTLYNYYNCFEEATIDLEILCMQEFVDMKYERKLFETGYDETIFRIKELGSWFLKNKELTTFLTLFDYSFTKEYTNDKFVTYLNEHNPGLIFYNQIKRGIDDGSIIKADPLELSYTLAQLAYAYIQKFVYHEIVPTYSQIVKQIGEYDLFVTLLGNSIQKKG